MSTSHDGYVYAIFCGNDIVHIGVRRSSPNVFLAYKKVNNIVTAKKQVCDRLQKYHYPTKLGDCYDAPIPLVINIIDQISDEYHE
jgi:hypothetical protein